MTEIVVGDLFKSYRLGRSKKLTAVNGVSFDVPDHELLVLLGPSGCGKSTILRCLAGLDPPDSGTIRFGENTVFDRSQRLDVAAHRRDIGLVFQSFALWPHLSARANIEFPLRSRHVPAAQRASKVDEVGELVDLGPDLLAKRPGQLSGGQQQRVALARALVARPSVLLFDEPLSNLDANLREQLRTDLHALHQELGFTGVYVTHDLAEALALGDQIAVMLNGVIAQRCAPRELFQRPASREIATFLGLRRVCRIESSTGGWQAAYGAVDGPLPEPGTVGPLDLFARPEDLTARRPADPVRSGRISLSGGKLQLSAFQGDQVEIVVGFDSGDTIKLRASEQIDLGPVGSPVVIDVACAAVRFYGDDGGLLPGHGAAA